MKLKHYVSGFLIATLLAGCATTDTAPQQPKPASPATPDVPPPEQVAPPPPPPPPAPPPPEVKPAASSKELDDEAKRLAALQKSYFEVFRIDEASAGLKPRQNATGVFELQKAPRGDRLRLVVALHPKKPARLAVGTYNVTLDTVVDYVETQTCTQASCTGKIQKVVRSLARPVQIQISPLNKYYGNKDLSLAEFRSADSNAKTYRSSYSDVVVTVKRITAVQVPPAPTAQ
jgi:hypothetical protein